MLIKQSSTAFPLLFLMVDSTDHVTGKAGLSPTVTLSKAGGSFNAPSGSVTEVANGWYKVAGNATDTATLGQLILHASVSGADPVDVCFEVVAFDPQVATNLGLSSLPTANPAASGGLLTVGTGSGQLNPIHGSPQYVADSGTATGGGVNSITLASGAASSNSAYVGMLVFIVSGAGAGQARMISAYNGGTKNAYVAPAFGTGASPDSSSVYVILPCGNEQAAYGVWEQIKYDHTSSLSYGKLIADIEAKTSAMPNSIWNALTSGMTTTGSIGKKLADATFGGASASDIWTYGTRSLTDKSGFTLHSDYDASKTAASAANLAIVDGIVDDILADTAALDLRLPASPAAVGSAMTLTSGERSTLADSIWDEVLSGHSGAGSAGLALSNAGGALDAAATAAAVWGALRATYSGAGTFGEYSRASLERVAGSATVDGMTLTAWFENILAHAAGDVVRSVNTYDYKKQDGVTTAFSFTSSAGGRS